MKVVVVFFSLKKNQNLRDIATALAKGIETQGCNVDIIDAAAMPDRKLVIYNYIAVGTEQTSFLGKISEKITYYLREAGSLTGKKSLAFILKSTVGSTKALLELMGVMEKEGMFIKNSLVFKQPGEAFEAGKKLHILSS